MLRRQRSTRTVTLVVRDAVTTRRAKRRDARRRVSSTTAVHVSYAPVATVILEPIMSNRHGGKGSSTTCALGFVYLHRETLDGRRAPRASCDGPLSFVQSRRRACATRTTHVQNTMTTVHVS